MPARGQRAYTVSTGRHMNRTRPAGGSTTRSPGIPASWSTSTSNSRRTNSRAAHSRRCAATRSHNVLGFRDRIDAIAVEREMILDGNDRRVGCFVGPYRVAGFVTAGWDAVVGAIALVRTVGRVRGSL